MGGRELQHFFHEHLLILKAEEHKSNGGNDHQEVEISCDGCRIPIMGPFYSCRECPYFLHKVCAELPSELDHPFHPEHPLTLLSRSPYVNAYSNCHLCKEGGRDVDGLFKFVYHCSICRFVVDMKCASPTHKIKDNCHPHPLTPLQFLIAFVCSICRRKEEGFSYKCYSCPFWAHQNCILQAGTVEHSNNDHPYPLIKLQHLFHDHPLILLAYERKTEDGINHSNMEIKCYGCRTKILGPFYSCGECRYFLHKVCAELSSVLNHPMHPQHPLTLVHIHPYYKCSLCREIGSQGVVYVCSKCDFYVDVKCASAIHVLQDKCHPHPLTPSDAPNSFPCHVCQVDKKGLSYRCNICPFWVHQNCTLMIPNTVKHSYHDHILKLFPSIPFEFSKVSEYCDICHGKLFMFQCIYGCDRCLFFAHISCARSEIIQSTSRDQNTDGESLFILPMKQDSMDVISRFVRNYINIDANIDDKIIHFDHDHPLFLIDEKTTDKTCEACAIQILSPFYGCVDCDYFLHKCCADLPKNIRHRLHPEHQLTLSSAQTFFWFNCCWQLCNSFFYKCSQCKDFSMDIKCASILQGDVVYHEAHRHPLKPVIDFSKTCTACGSGSNSKYILECNTCSFKLCLRCAMAPSVIKHRFGKSEPFRLTYSPPENHYNEYICEICLEELNPKRWFYYCVYGDQFTHIKCMIKYGADSHINYGKSIKIEKIHEHELTCISCTYNASPCSKCRHALRIGRFAGHGLECKTCNFRVHLYCP